MSFTSTTNPRALTTIMTSVAKGAQAVGALFDSTTNSIGMLDALVTKASEDQRLRYRKERRTFVHNLVREASEEQSQSDLRVDEFCKQSPRHAELFNAAYSEFSELFADELKSSK